MDIRIEGRYKSIENIVATDLPNFCLISGVNGSGKTQFLEAVGRKFSPAPNPDPIVNLSPQFRLDQIALLKELPKITGFGLGQFGQVKPLNQNLIPRLINLVAKRRNNPNLGSEATAETLEEQILGAILDSSVGDISEIDEQRIVELLQKHSMLGLQFGQERDFISQIFYNYRYRYVVREEEGIKSKKAFEATYGPPPWVIFREVIESFDLPIKINDAANHRIEDPFILRLAHSESGEDISPIGLSTGEQSILSLAMWLYRSNSKGLFPKLILLDEPDVHLHPSFVNKLLDFILNVLIGRHGSHVVMTSHSPTTVALAPSESLCEMLPRPSRLRRCSSKSQAIANLTSGFLSVLPAHRCVYTEAPSDSLFLQSSYDRLKKGGHLDGGMDITFFPATNVTADGKPGGKFNVIQRVKDFGNTPMESLVKGLIDGDGETKKYRNIYRLKRFCLENYLFDPLVVHITLVRQGKAPVIPGIGKTKLEDLGALLKMTNSDLQKIADYYVKLIDRKCPEKLTPRRRERVEYLCMKAVRLPAWYFELDGKKVIAPIYKDHFKSAKLDYYPLMQAYREFELVPLELIQPLAGVAR